MDGRKWIAIMIASMLVLLGVAGILVHRPELVTSAPAVVID